jgi:hypothetical protein
VTCSYGDISGEVLKLTKLTGKRQFNDTFRLSYNEISLRNWVAVLYVNAVVASDFRVCFVELIA